MLWYFLKCRKNNASKNPNVAMTKNRKIMFLAKSSVRGSEKSRFIKGKEPSGFLISLGIKTPLTKIF